MFLRGMMGGQTMLGHTVYEEWVRQFVVLDFYKLNPCLFGLEL